VIERARLLASALLDGLAGLLVVAVVYALISGRPVLCALLLAAEALTLLLSHLVTGLPRRR